MWVGLRRVDMISRCGPPVSWQDVSVASSEQWLSHAGHHTRLPPPAGLLRGKNIFSGWVKIWIFGLWLSGNNYHCSKVPWMFCWAGSPVEVEVGEVPVIWPPLELVPGCLLGLATPWSRLLHILARARVSPSLCSWGHHRNSDLR